MVDKTILHLVDPFDKTWNNIAEHAISIIPDLFNYSLFVMSNILDIMVLNNNIND